MDYISDFSSPQSLEDFSSFNSNGSLSLDSGKLLVSFISSGNSQGALELNKLFKRDLDISFYLTLKSDSLNRKHAGFWVSNEAKTSWIRGYFLDKTFGLVSLRKGYNPTNTLFLNQKDIPTDNFLKIEEKRLFRIRICSGILSMSVDGVLQDSFPCNFKKVRFYIFGYVCNLSVEQLKIKELNSNSDSFEYWRISNIKTSGKKDLISLKSLEFKTKSGKVSDNLSYVFSSGSSDSVLKGPQNAFDNNESTYTEADLDSSWSIGYKFDTPEELDSVSISMKNPENLLENEGFWTSFDIEGSNDNLEWVFYKPVLNTKIFKNDNSIHTYNLASVKAKFWRVSNINLRHRSYNNGSVAILRFNTLSGVVSDIPERGFTKNYLNSTYLPSNAFDGDKNTATYTPHHSNSDSNSGVDYWFIGYEFENPEKVISVDLQMWKEMRPEYGQEWIDAQIDFSHDGETWEYFGEIYPNFKSMELDLKSDIPVINLNNFLPFEYFLDESILLQDKFKFWRCNNINTLPSLTDLSFNISGSVLNFINKENLKLINTENSFSSSHAKEEVGLGVASNGFDKNPETWFHSQYSVDQTQILKNYEDYYIGCMFEEPVEVVKIGYKPRPNMNVNWGQQWQSCNIEYSPNGFDWFQKGYCDFNIKRISSDYVVKDIQPTDALESFQHWRVSKVFNQGSATYPQFTGYNQGFSGWELRFNTLTGERSNVSSRGYSNGSWDASWTPDKAFDGNIQSNAGGFHQKKDNDSQFYIAYKFNTPQHVNSISILPRRDSDLPHQSWLLAHIEASHDGIDWEFRGYANLNCGSNTRFYTARLEDLSLFDSLNSSDLTSTIKNLDIYNPESNGIYRGQVLEVNEPVVKQVALYERNTRRLVAIVWSDSEGFYEFKNLNQNKTYYVHAIDNNKIYNAVTKDMLDLRINSEYK